MIVVKKKGGFIPGDSDLAVDAPCLSNNATAKCSNSLLFFGSIGLVVLREPYCCASPIQNCSAVAHISHYTPVHED